MKKSLFILFVLGMAIQVAYSQRFPSEITLTHYDASKPEVVAEKRILIQPASSGESFRVPANNPFRAYLSDSCNTGWVSNLNFVKTEDMLVAGDINTSHPAHKKTTYVYMDGLGRPIQTVAVKATPGGNDLVTPQAYDPLGRQTQTFLSYAASSCNGHYRPEALTEQKQFYNPVTPYNQGVKTDNAPYSVTTFEPSPLGLPQSQAGPGEAWQESGNEKQTHFQYSINKHGTGQGEERIINWVYNAAADLLNRAATNGGYYSSGQLKIKLTIDENDNMVREYTDKEGNVILKKVQVAENVPNGGVENFNDWAYTYYVYDAQNRLIYTIPPEAVKQLLAQL